AGGSLGGGLWARGRGAARERWFRFAVLVALLGVYVHAAFDYPLQIVALQLYVGSYLGLGWASAGGGRLRGKSGEG
ncbi:MAG TPA: hypothetical protein VHQ47_14670, partial [Phycisphaerae bacterium]|nr:hypothetical protein [Phycisphaerae bacterium]